MRKKILYLSAFLLFLPFAGQAQSLNRTAKDFREYIGVLAGEELAGRAAGTRGDTLAVEYLRDFLDDQRGIELLFDDGLQAFTAQSWFNKVNSFNVVGFIEGNDPVLKNEVIVIGAHYDHMGLEAGNFGEEPKIKFGADDNASGTAMVMALARRLAKDRRHLKRSVMIVFFGAEERGLVGSRYLTEHMPPEVPIGNVVCMVNFDMVGRLTPERGVILFGLGSGKELDGLLRSRPWPYGELAPVSYNATVFAASDHSSFYDKEVPAFMFMTGIHADYHTSADTADKINYTGMVLVYRYALQIIDALAVDALPVTYQAPN